jgi:flagellar biosynthesis/type III secretory pathway chaperone
MKNRIKDLINCLIVEKCLYEKAIELSEAKKEIIMKNDFLKLDSIVEKETSLINDIKKIEQKRDKLCSEISEYLGIDGQKATLSDIIEKADDVQCKNRLRQLLDEFGSIIKTYRDLNDTNKNLIEKTLQYIEFMLEKVLKQDNNVTYGKEVNSGVVQEINIFDQRV